jgi:hypothetical protein
MPHCGRQRLRAHLDREVRAAYAQRAAPVPLAASASPSSTAPTAPPAPQNRSSSGRPFGDLPPGPSSRHWRPRPRPWRRRRRPAPRSAPARRPRLQVCSLIRSIPRKSIPRAVLSDGPFCCRNDKPQSEESLQHVNDKKARPLHGQRPGQVRIARLEGVARDAYPAFHQHARAAAHDGLLTLHSPPACTASAPTRRVPDGWPKRTASRRRRRPRG